MKYKLLILLCLPLLCFSQSSFKKSTGTISSVHVTDPKLYQPTYEAKVIHRVPNELTMGAKNPSKLPANNKQYTSGDLAILGEAEEPVLKKGIRMVQEVDGVEVDVTGLVPNDNHMAISNDGIVLSVTNSLLWAFDTRNDEILFTNGSLPLQAISVGESAVFDFDPRVLYDPEKDRFIVVFFRDFAPELSEIHICVSSTNNPLDPWHSYRLEGDIDGSGSWADYPNIAMSENDLLITFDLIRNTDAIGALLLVNREQLFTIGSEVDYTVWSDLQSENYVFNYLCPVRGADGVASKELFLGKKIDELSDELFLFYVSDSAGVNNNALKMVKLQTDAYVYPPYGIQPSNGGLKVWDFIYGAIEHQDWIQYVMSSGNIDDPNTYKYPCIYHGTINGYMNDSLSLTGKLICHGELSLAYPNIAWAGKDDCDRACVIGASMCSREFYPGHGAIYYSNNGEYSNPIWIKEGENRLSGYSQRWGDYSGVQRRFSKPGSVWMSGTFGNFEEDYATWIGSVSSPDTNHIQMIHAVFGDPANCQGLYPIHVKGGIPPYNISVNGNSVELGDTLKELCNGDSLKIVVVDARYCSQTQDVVIAEDLRINQSPSLSDYKLFPNPTRVWVKMEFQLEQTQVVQVGVYDLNGRLLDWILHRKVKGGLNELQFNISHLASGTYMVELRGEKGFHLTEKVIKL